MTRITSPLALGLALLLGPGDAAATGAFATAFIAGPWPDVRTDAALAQQLAREAIGRTERLQRRNIVAVLDPKGDPASVVAVREGETAFRKGFVALSNESFEAALKHFAQSALLRMSAAARLESPAELVQSMQYAGAAALRQGEYRKGIRWFHRASVLDPQAPLEARGVRPATVDLYERVRRRATGLPPADLRVLSEPDGASVFLDGRFVGATPAVVPVPLPGTHLLRIEKDGYLKAGQDVEVLPGPTEEVSFALQPAKRLAKFRDLLDAAMPLLDKDDRAKAPLATLTKILGVKSIVLGRLEPRGEDDVALVACEYDEDGDEVGLRGSQVFAYRSAAFRQEATAFFDALLAGDGEEDPRFATLPPPPPPGESAVADLVAMDDGPPVYATWWFWTGVGVITAGGGAAAVAGLPEETPRRKPRGEIIFQF